MSDLARDQRVGDDADRVTARGQHGVGKDAHQPDGAAAEHETDAAPRHLARELLGGLGILNSSPDTRAAEHADADGHVHTSMCLITQIESTGRSHIDRLNLNANYRIPQKRLLLSANYTLSSVMNDSDNALQLPANSLDIDSEWGPASQDVRHRFNGMMNMTLPAAIRASVTATAPSAAPYTITTGRDDNGDGVSNDRPAGTGRNSARGTARVDMTVRLTRGFAFGGARQGQGGRGGVDGGPIQIAGGPGGARPGGPGGRGGPGGAGLAGGQANQRFNVEFYAQASNVINHTNFLNFSGNLQSPFFGRPTSAAAARHRAGDAVPVLSRTNHTISS